MNKPSLPKSPDFTEFLKWLLETKKFKTWSEFYRKLGGKAVFGVTASQLRQIARGVRQPTPELLATIFSVTPASMKQQLVWAYFESLYKRNQNGKRLTKFLHQHLQPAFEQEELSIWDTAKERGSPIPEPKPYSDEQLDFLRENPSAFRFFKSVHLRDDRVYTVAKCPLPSALLRKMEDLGLVAIKGGKITTANALFRVPSLKTASPPRSRAKGYEFIMNHGDQYFSREGSEKQILLLSTQMSDPDWIKAAFRNAEEFNHYIQRGAKLKHDPAKDKAVVFFVGMKELDDSEI